MAMSQQSVLGLVATLALLFTGSAASILPFCPDGKGDCDYNLKNGCETDIFSDPMNCGKCRAVCEERYGYVSVCNDGKCDFACKAGYADCNYSIKDACETYIGGDEKNCGACGVVCEERPGYLTSCEHGTCVYVDKCTIIKYKCLSYPNAESACKAGNCTATCSPGYADCNHNLPKDGCEVNVYTDTGNCGACGVVCKKRPGYITSCEHGQCVYVDKCTLIDCRSYPNAETACKAGKCTATCSPGYADCNKNLEKDGCEVEVYTDNHNCGACGVECEERPGYFTSCEHGKCVYVDKCTATLCLTFPNAETACKAGKCTATCSPGYADCNQNLEKDGCEVKVYTDNHNCGACGVECEERHGYFTSCENGQCVYVDKCTKMDCPSYPNAEATCKEGKCSVSCSPGYADCNQNLEKDGCEVKVYTDNHNCGACGNDCPKFSVCSKGVCKKL